MRKEYRYRKHVRWGQYVIIPIVVGIWLLFFVLFPLRLSALPSGESLVIGLGPIFTFLVAILVAYLNYRMAAVCVSFDDEGIVYRYRGGEKHLGFNEISRIAFPSVRYLGGWVKIVSADTTLRLTVVLEGIDDFLLELKAALDKRGLTERYDPKRFFRFLKTAACSDQSWARIYCTWWKTILFMILNGAVGYVFSILSGAGSEMILWVGLSALWPPVVWVVVELIFFRRVAKLSVEESFTCPPRDLAYERAVNRKALLLGALFYLAISVMILILMLDCARLRDVAVLFLSAQY